MANTTGLGFKPEYEGKARKYIVADDAHEYIKKHGGGKFLTEHFRKHIEAEKNM